DRDQLPLLVGAAPVAVLHDRRAVGGGGPLHLQGPAAGAVDRADVATGRVGQTPLLVGGVVVGPLHHRGAVGRREVVVVEHLARMPGLDPVVAAAGAHELELLV